MRSLPCSAVSHRKKRAVTPVAGGVLMAGLVPLHRPARAVVARAVRPSGVVGKALRRPSGRVGGRVRLNEMKPLMHDDVDVVGRASQIAGRHPDVIPERLGDAVVVRVELHGDRTGGPRIEIRRHPGIRVEELLDHACDAPGRGDPRCPVVTVRLYSPSRYSRADPRGLPVNAGSGQPRRPPTATRTRPRSRRRRGRWPTPRARDPQP
jgi:hypothetical protein